MKVYKIIPGEGLNPCCEKDVNAIISWLTEATAGEVIKIEITEMPEEEYNNLPEYMGP